MNGSVADPMDLLWSKSSCVFGSDTRIFSITVHGEHMILFFFFYLTVSGWSMLLHRSSGPIQLTKGLGITNILPKFLHKKGCAVSMVCPFYSTSVESSSYLLIKWPFTRSIWFSLKLYLNFKGWPKICKTFETLRDARIFSNCSEELGISWW